MIPNQWYPIIESKNVNAKPMGIERLGERLVVWRNSDHKVVIQRDECVHKRARLSGGAIRNGCLECPYHGLQYESSGECVLVPFMDKDYDIPKNWKVEINYYKLYMRFYNRF